MNKILLRDIKMENDINQLLIRSLEESLDEKDQIRLDRALEQSEQLRNEHAELLAMRELIQNQEFQFSPFFSGKVLQKVFHKEAKIPELGNALVFAFNRIAIPVLALIVVLLINTYASHESLSIDAISGVSELSVDDVVADFFVSN